MMMMVMAAVLETAAGDGSKRRPAEAPVRHTKHLEWAWSTRVRPLFAFTQ